MTDAVQISLISVIGTVLIAVITNFGNKLLRKSDEMATKVDGRLTELLELTRKSSHAEGVKDEKEKEKDRQ